MATLPSHFSAPPTDFPTVRWGVLGAANIAIKKVIPAMQASGTTPVVAIASRDLAKSRAADRDLGEKLERYQTTSSLRDVLLVDPERVDVRHVRRTAEGWETRRFQAPDAVVDLHAADLPIAAVYVGVEAG